MHYSIRYDWMAGDIAIVHKTCVHQHFNASDTTPARAMVLKTKPMYLFMNLLCQKEVEPRSLKAAVLAGEGYLECEAEVDYNHSN